ncbi:MAG: DUF6320 domain-containing protein [Clostridiales Family XIII bacterium]|jgi:hypothetical protein|nr:DUF6320 domain-containing protein [Clostridiales Family XIII bacterium]
MKRCTSCSVDVESEHTKCPLCQRSLIEVTDGSVSSAISDTAWYPAYGEGQIKKQFQLFRRLIDFLAISVASIGTVINLLTDPQNLWCLYLVTCVVYAWITFRHTILSRVHIGAKVLVQIFALMAFLFVVNVLAGGEKWSLDYTLPFIICGATLFITIVMIVKRMRWKEFSGFVITLIILGFIPLLLNILGLTHAMWAAAIAGLYAFLTLAGMLIFSDKGFKDDMFRRFHF